METLDWLRLYRSENVGPINFFRLIDRFGTAAKALEALPDLARRGGKKHLRICPKNTAEAELAAIERLGGRLLPACDPLFPKPLRATDTAPLLTLLGDPSLLNRRCIALVGARDASLGGRKIAHKLATDLGQTGFCVVSGLARGIDTAAHSGALASGTVAVLAGGLDQIYPPENRDLYRRIAEQGCIVSEMPPGTIAQAQHFPRRNRLISGLSEGVVVVEAKIRSGSLITARLALEQGREVFAVPGSPLDPRSAGPNGLIKQGALLVERAEDVIDALGIVPTAQKPAENIPPIDPQSLTEAHSMVERCLSGTAVTVDEILRECQLSPSTLSLVLLELELAGRLLRHPDHSVSLG